jgi:hypothetical protein
VESEEWARCEQEASAKSAIAGGAAAAEWLPITKNEGDGTTARWAHPLPHSVAALQEGPAAESRCEWREHFVAPMRRQHWQDSALEPKEASRNGAIGSSRDETNNSRAVSLCPNTPANVVSRLMLRFEIPLLLTIYRPRGL